MNRLSSTRSATGVASGDAMAGTGAYARGASGGIGLLDASGVPFAGAELRAALCLEEAVTPAGEPLFPDAPGPAEVVGELAEERSGWFRMRPGVDLASVLDALEPAALDDEQLVEAIRAHGRLIAHHEARMAGLMAELASRPPYNGCPNPAENPHNAVGVAASEVSLAMGWTPSHADAQVGRAATLVNELPATLEALSAGVIDAYKARVIEEATSPLAGRSELRTQVEAEALAVAGQKSVPALRAFIKRSVAKVDPEGTEERRESARQGRRVDKPYTESDGMASMQVYGPVEDLAALFTALDAAARARRDAVNRGNAADEATVGQSKAPGMAADGSGPAEVPMLAALRFDVLADLAWAALNAGHLGCCNLDCPGAPSRLGSQQGRAAAVNVTVPLSTLIGVDEQPAELAGYGPISPTVVRRIAADATIRRILTDPASGALLDYGTTRYTPPAHLREHVLARDRTCRFATCGYPARAAQIDHTMPYRPDGSGGATAHDNLGVFHGRHHNDKTHHGFGVTQPEPGRFVITTPAGLSYHVDPEVIGPITEPAGRAANEPAASSTTTEYIDGQYIDGQYIDGQYIDGQYIDGSTFNTLLLDSEIFDGDEIFYDW